jgi:hypothetical protein
MIKQMKKLVFNTTEKSVILYDSLEERQRIFTIDNTPTVKVCPEGFYEVFVKDPNTGTGRPKVRIPINEVIMFIED